MMLTSCFIVIFTFTFANIKNIEEKISPFKEELNYVFTKGDHRMDKYGIDLNANILDGMYNTAIDNDINKSIEDWSLYIPPCPNLEPVKHSDYVMNPLCEHSSLQFLNYQNYNNPISLPLNYISNQMEKFKEWKVNNNTNPYYGDQDYQQLLSEDYHPYDYGYQGEETFDISDTEYYGKLVQSRMDEVPDPRRRRLFTFILFNTEFDLLDLYLSEYYNIIDYFVIYESNSTFSGQTKPLYFTRMLLETNRYDKFKDKLIPLPCEIIIEEDNGRGTALPKEHLARRNLIEKGLKSVHARHGDLFMHGDLDEFPRAHILTRLKRCGGWEHLQAGIGGAPKSFKFEKADSYLINKDMNVKMTSDGEYDVDYTNEISLGFLAWSYEYSFKLVENKTIGTVPHPNLVIFDARRSLGQLPEFNNYYNSTLSKRSNNEPNYDPLLDPNFDPYQGYTYSVHHTDRRIGTGYVSEHIRFDTSKLSVLIENKRPVLWSGSWHMSSFLPTIDLFYNKIKSYSHYDTFSGDEKRDKNKIMSRIKKKIYIFGPKKKYYNNNPLFPASYTEGYNYNFDYSYWKNNTLKGNKKFNQYKDLLVREVPTHLWKNPICYSYMLDRDFGFTKKLWWQVTPKVDWDIVQFDKLEPKVLQSITPKIVSKKYQNDMFKAMAENKRGN